jgi:hypothetical protein
MYVRGYLQGSENGRVVTIASNGNKSQKFVSLIDAPYFKNAFAPGALDHIYITVTVTFTDKRLHFVATISFI